MQDKRVLYIISGRGFSKNHLGRKLSEVINCWRNQLNHLDVIFGKDLIFSNTVVEQKYGHQTYHEALFRNNALLRPFVHSVSELRDIAHDFRLYRILRSQYKQNKYSLIWERSSRLHIAGLIFAKNVKLPFVLEWKDNLINYKISLFKLYAQFVEYIKIRFSDFIVVESGVLKSQMIAKGVKAEKIVVAHNAVDADEFSKNATRGKHFRARLGVKDHQCLVGYLGSYAFYHNPQLLIKAAKVVFSATQSPDDIVFLMVGNGMFYKQCRSLANDYALTERQIIFLDGVPKEDVPKILSGIDVAVLPGSTDIICPIKVFEYMAAETAVVLPDYECHREILSEQEGIFFEANNEKSLASAINKLNDNNILRRNLAQKASELARAKYNWSSTWGQALCECIETATGPTIA